jgi:hypothetical protein
VLAFATVVWRPRHGPWSYGVGLVRLAVLVYGCMCCIGGPLSSAQHDAGSPLVSCVHSLVEVLGLQGPVVIQLLYGSVALMSFKQQRTAFAVRLIITLLQVLARTSLAFAAAASAGSGSANERFVCVWHVMLQMSWGAQPCYSHMAVPVAACNGRHCPH